MQQERSEKLFHGFSQSSTAPCDPGCAEPFRTQGEWLTSLAMLQASHALGMKQPHFRNSKSSEIDMKQSKSFASAVQPVLLTCEATEDVLLLRGHTATSLLGPQPERW